MKTGINCPAANTQAASTTDLIASWEFRYDGDGNRVWQMYTAYNPDGTPQTGLTRSYFAGGSYEIQFDGTTTKPVKYYSFAGTSIAMDDGSGLKYFLTDHLGSVVAVTDASGNPLSQQRYMPFGDVRSDAGKITQTDFGYTGQRNLDEQGNASLGLMDYHARFYDAYITRFTQPDTIVSNLYNPQGLNRYTYVANDPINAMDPTGNKASCIDETDANGQCINNDVDIYDNTPDGAPSVPTDPTTPTNPPKVYDLAAAKAVLENAGVEIYNLAGWDPRNIIDAANAVLAIGMALMGLGAGNSWYKAFSSIFGPVRFIWGEEYKGSHFGNNNTEKDAWATCYYVGAGCSPGSRDGKMNILFNLHFGTGLYFETIVAHELGHTFSYMYGKGTEAGSTYALGNYWLKKGADNILNGTSPSTYRHSSSDTPTEIFADMFTAFTYGSWNQSSENAGMVWDASQAMKTNLYEWIR